MLLIPDIFVTAQTVLYHCTIASYHCTFCVSLHSILCPASLCLIKIILDLLMISRLLWVIFLLKKTLNAKQIFGVVFLLMIKLMLVGLGLWQPLRIRMDHVIWPKGRCGPFFFSAAQFFNSLSRAVTWHKLCSFFVSIRTELDT